MSRPTRSCRPRRPTRSTRSRSCSRRWGLGRLVVRELGLGDPAVEPDLASWRALVDRIKAPKPVLEIALVGKYIELPDAYLSVTEALRHAAWAHGVDAKVRWVDSEALTHDNLHDRLDGAAGILVPGGFGHRGIEGKVLAAHFAREHRIPYLGLCLGLQCAVIEFAREVVGTADANSTEFDMFTEHPVIDFMPDQRDMEDKGGTMRLGLYPARLTPGSKAAAVYGQEVIYERHRHRFEVNNRYRQTLEAAGMVLSGQSPDGRLVEIVELRDHPWFVASQFHPEFKSRPERPHPLFDGFVAASLAVRDGREPVFAARRSRAAGRRRRRAGRYRRDRPERLEPEAAAEDPQAPGPGVGRIESRPIGSPQRSHVARSVPGWPHGSWTSSRGGPAGPAVHLSPHASSAAMTGNRSRPFSVRTYSSRGGCSW